MKPVRSVQYFLHKLRSLESVKAEIFKELLTTYGDCLIAGLHYYKPKSAQLMKKEELMKDLNNDQLADFVVEISQALNLDLAQSYDIFCGYLLYDYSGPIRDSKSLIADIGNRKELLVDIQAYYHREQIALLMSIVEILKLMQRARDQLPHLAMLEKLIFKHLAKPAFVDSLLISFKGVWEKQIEGKTTGAASALGGAVLARHYFAVQEQLVRVLIWLFYVANLHVECEAGVFKFFVDQNFGRKQFYKKMLPAYESEEFIDRIFNLEVLFTLKLFDLETLMLIYCVDTRDQDIYWLNNKSTKTLTSVLDAYISATSHDQAAIALFYTLNVQLRRLIISRNHVSPSEELTALDTAIQKYGSIARRNDCLRFCVNFLASGAILADEDTLSLARSVVYVALDGCLQFFETESIGPAEDIATLFSDVLLDTSVAEEFWGRSFSSGASNYVLNEIVYNFYASFHRPLRILRSLAAASMESCQKVINLCQKLPVFSECVEDVDPHDLALVDDIEDMEDEGCPGQCYVLVKPRQPFEIDGPIIPPGTRGRIVKPSIDSEEYFQWEYSYNAWQLCLLEITKNNANPSRVAAVLELIGTILDTDPSSATLFVHFLKEAVAILKRARYFDADVLVFVLEPCLRCLAAAAKTFPYEVLAQVGDDDILPNSKPLSHAEFRLSLTCRILNDVERLSGQYGCTISFLRLIEYCCDDINCYELPSFGGSISYICDSIFPDCLSWPYDKPEHRNEIATACLRICRKILEKWTAMSEERHIAVKETVDICRIALTQGDSRRSLLRLVSVGVDVLKDPNALVEDGYGQDQGAETVSLALALLLELLIDYERSRISAAAPKIFVDLFLSTASSGNVGMEPPLCAIGRYLFLKTNDRVPKLAVVCLKKIAMLFPATILSTYGEWASAFCDAFLTRLESPAEDVQLKVYCIEFLTTAVQHQPGLAEQLLGVSTTTDNNDAIGTTSASQPKINGSCGALDCVLALMKGDRLLPDLAMACVNLLAMIWCTDTATAMDYLRDRKTDAFWQTLLAPLSAGEDSYYLTIVSPIIRILTREIFANLKSSKFLTKLIAHGGGSAAIINTVTEEITEAERLKLTFKKLQDYCISRIEFKDKVDVLGAWRDFFQVLFDVKISNDGLGNDSRREILTGSIAILKLTLDHFEPPGGITVVKVASELCGLTLKHCLSVDTPHCQQGVIKEFEPVFYRLNDGHVEEWLLQLSVLVLPVCGAALRVPKMSKEETESLPSIFDAVCSILVKNLIQTATLHSKDLLESPKFSWMKSLQSSLRCLVLLYSNVTYSENGPGRSNEQNLGRTTSLEKDFLEILQKHSVLRNLRVLMATLLDAGHFDESLLTLVCLLFGVTAKSPESLSMIRYSGFLEWICVDLVTAPKAITYCMEALSALFSVHISLLEAGGHTAVPACTTFLASYSDIVVQLIVSFAMSPMPISANAISRSLKLLILMANYKDRWQLEALESQTLMIDAVSLLCHRLPPYLSKPAVLAELLSKSKDTSRAEVDTKAASVAGDPKETLMMLTETLLSGVQFLLRFSPDLLDICNNPSFDPEAFRPLLALDLNTNLTPEMPSASEEEPISGSFVTSSLTFGAVLLIVHTCVNSLRKFEAVKSASPLAHHASVPPLLTTASDKGKFAALLESALYLLLSQAALYIKRGGLDTWQRTLLKRDLAAEITQYLSRCGIRSGTGSSPTTPRKSPTPFAQSAVSPGTSFRMASTGFDYEFLKYVSEFVRNVLRNND